jgi:ankyrin repeat protein
MTALMLAVCGNYVDMVKLLLEHKANLEEQNTVRFSRRLLNHRSGTATLP